MGVDQPRQDHMLAGIEYFVARRGGLLAEAKYFDDQTVLQHQAATGVEVVGCKNGEGIF
jgi:hypothetical protein